jgi:hypothetical protein
VCIEQTNQATGKTQVAHEAQLSADSAVVSVCAEKVREAERKFELERARADTAEARVKDLEIRLKDALAAGDSVL